MSNFTTGIILGVASSGALIGLIPLIAGKKRGNAKTGLEAFIKCIVINTIAYLLLYHVFNFQNSGTWSGIGTLVYAILATNDIRPEAEKDETHSATPTIAENACNKETEE